MNKNIIGFIGLLMVSAPFIAVTICQIKEEGWMSTIRMWLAIIGIITLMAGGVYLMFAFGQ